MSGFSSRTRKNSSARAERKTMSAAAAMDKKTGAPRLKRRGTGPRIKSNLGAAHSQLDGGHDQHDSHRNSYPCFGTGKKSTGVDQMPYAGCNRAGIIYNAAIMRPIILRAVERHRRQRGQAPADDMTHHARSKKYALQDIKKQRRQYGPQHDGALRPG